MSGLVKFLQNTLVSPSTKASSSESKSTTVEYSQSLLTMTTCLQDDDEGGGSAAAAAILEGTKEQPFSSSSTTTNTTTASYAEWKECCNAILSKYLSLRFDEDAAEDETNLHPRVLRSAVAAARSSSEDNNHHQSSSEEPSSQQPLLEPDTQEELGQGVICATTPSPQKMKQLVPIPHISLACHKATSISEINMYTETLNLDLCQVVKIYPVRSTRRFEHMFKNQLINASSSNNNEISFTGDNSVMRFPPLQHHNNNNSIQSDGPLFSLYRKVLSMEIVQLESSAPKDFLGNQHNLFGHSKPTRRLLLYLYHDYATFLDTFLDSIAGKKNDAEKNDLFLSLSNIPACCIIPFDGHTESFLNMAERDLSPYAIAIGGPSKAVLNKTNDRLSFESDSLEITVVSTNPDEDTDTTSTAVDEGTTTTCIKPFTGAQICPKEPVDTIQAQEQLYDRVMQWHNQKSSNKSKSSSFNLPENPTTVAAASPSKSPNKKRSNEGAEEEEQTNNTNLKTPPTKKQKSSTNENSSTTTTPNKNADTAAVGDDETTTNARTMVVEGYDTLSKVPDRLTQHRNSPRKRRQGPPTVNVVGIVWAFSQPSRTKRNSWTMSVNLVDPSIIGNAGGIVRIMLLQIFRNKRHDLPTMLEAGNLLVITGAGIQHYKGEVQLLGRNATNMQVSVPTFDASCPSVLYNTRQWKSMKRLWNWGQAQFAKRTTLSDASLQLRVHDFPVPSQLPQQKRPDDVSCGDLTVMISAILPISTTTGPNTTTTATGPIGYLRVWDGTGAPISDPLPPPLSTPEIIQKLRTGGDPPTAALVKIKEATTILNTRELFSLSSSSTQMIFTLLSETVVLTGRVINVAVWELPHWEYLSNHCHVGMFVRLRNVQKQQELRSEFYDRHVGEWWLSPVFFFVFEVSMN
mmetsp:Transcript_16761/g.24777  ORF Transcript_16761/g.24777 Transcript_16761/m.24777 type:complete len:912 (-) Transcript_16761:1086-3821(-)